MEERKRERYINPFTDFGFKKIFGEEANKDLLLDFLNELLKEEQGDITSLTFIKNDQLGNTPTDRKAIFDLYCESKTGEKFIVELQKAEQKFFKDRALYYSTFPIQEQAPKGTWDYQLTKVYTIGILDFSFEKNEEDKYLYNVQLTDTETCEIFYDKLTFVYLEMPKFNKTLDELNTHFDKWLYLIKNLSKLEEIPEKLQERIFQKVFSVAEIANLTKEEYRDYRNSVKYYSDIKNSLDLAEKRGVQKGIEQGIEQVALNGIRKGKSDEVIIELTGLTKVQLEYLKEKVKMKDR